MGTPYAGPYGWKYHPWVKEILDSEATLNVTLKSAQAGLTEVAINRALWTIDTRQLNVLYVLPTKGNASDFSKDRFDGALHLSPYIKNIFTSTNTVGLKKAGATSLYIRGSRSDNDLKSVPAAVLILDEYDEMKLRSIKLAEERLSGAVDKETWKISTPTIPGFGVSLEYLTTTQEHFTFECPSCSRWTELTFPECLEVRGDSVNDPRTHESFLKCKECNSELPQEIKYEWLAGGTWRPTHTNGDPDRRGFCINQLYSSTITPQQLAVAYLEAQLSEAANQEWHNSKLGLPFLGESSRISDQQITNALRDYRRGTLQPQAGQNRLITLGIDQGKIGYWIAIEWTFESRGRDVTSLAHAKILDYGKFQQQEQGWDRPHELMREWQVRHCVVDADPEISDARRFAKAYPEFVHLSRYRSGVKGKAMSITDEDTDAPMATSDRTHWVGETLGKFRRGMVELPADASDEFKEHMQALVKRYEKDKETGDTLAKFVSVGPDHWAHCFVYAFQAMAIAMENHTENI